MGKIEKSLLLWFDAQHQYSVPLSVSIIPTKALNLYEDWKTRLNDDSNMVFQASNGRFNKFKTINSLHGFFFKFTRESTDADRDAAKDLFQLCPKLLKMENILLVKY